MQGPQQFRISPFQSDVLDLSRWVAAFLVVIEHLRSLMFTDYGTGGEIRGLGKAFYFMTGFGHSAVMVFFVMSGFLVGGKVLERLAHGTFSWQKYVVDRSSRLYAVYFLALVLGAVLDNCGYLYLNRFGLYNETFAGRIPVVNFNFYENLTWPIFALNLGMCQTVLGPVFGSNGPLWSLANEFWYYLAGPAFFLLFHSKARSRLVFCVGILAGLIWFLPSGILVYFLVWLMGAALYIINFRRVLPLWCSLLLFLACFSLARLQWLKVPFLADFLIGIAFSSVINSTAGSARRLPWHLLSRTAADFSYSVYLCHFPFLVFVLSALYQITGFGLRGPRTPLTFGLFFVVLLFVYVWCFLVSLITERQTSRIRQWLYRWLGQTALLKAR